jgi:hypothetical protein
MISVLRTVPVMFNAQHKTRFDWARAIAINRDALIAVVEAIFRLLGLEGEATLERLPHYLHRRALRLLRPAESAARRVIVMAARGLAVGPAPALRPRPAGVVPQKAKAPTTPGRPRRPAFQLHDPRKRFTERRRASPARHRLPRISVLGFDPPVADLWPASPPAANTTPLDDEGLINARPLCRRLQALKAALDDVPRQAQRLVRWRARRERDGALRPLFVTPLRPGLPPGYRKKPVREVDYLLLECHGLACEAIRLDTS